MLTLINLATSDDVPEHLTAQTGDDVNVDMVTEPPEAVQASQSTPQLSTTADGSDGDDGTQNVTNGQSENITKIENGTEEGKVNNFKISAVYFKQRVSVAELMTHLVSIYRISLIF